MINLTTRGKLAFAGVLAAAAIGSAAPAQADTSATPADCDARVERLEDQFYAMADRRSYEAAADWWDARWHAVYTSCFGR